MKNQAEARCPRTAKEKGDAPNPLRTTTTIQQAHPEQEGTGRD